jgi:ATP P2X receptor
VLRRDTLKLYGIDFIFLTTARGRRFDLVSLGISVGSGIGMLVFATLISDMVTMWCLRQSHFYRNRKVMNVKDQQAELERRNWASVLSEAELNRAYM